MEEQWRVFSGVMKYSGHILNSCCRRGDGGGKAAGEEAFAGITKFFRHISEDFCRDHEIF